MKLLMLFSAVTSVFFLLFSCAKKEEPYKDLPEGLYAEIKTAKGNILLKLEFEKTPMTVCNFVGLAEGTIKTPNNSNGEPFYDSLKFHRVVDNFVIQGGDPAGNGSGGPGYSFSDEIDTTLRHNKPGILSMANAGPGTNGSQFFITHKATPHLDGKHSVFGEVVQGMEVVNSIRQGDVMEKVTIIRKGDAAKQFLASKEILDSLEKAQKEKIKAEEERKLKEALDTIEQKFPERITSESGLMYVINQEGKGRKPKQGEKVQVHYVGTLLDGSEFDSSIKRDKPFEFNVGQGRVIKAWDEALSDMKKGEKRTLIVPPELGYGKRGYPPVIPPNSYLIFEVELLDFIK